MCSAAQRVAASGRPASRRLVLPGSSQLYTRTPCREDPDLPQCPRRQRKQVTVLFAGLKGSMDLLADRDPEESQVTWQDMAGLCPIALISPVIGMETVQRFVALSGYDLPDGMQVRQGRIAAHKKTAPDE